MHLFSLLLGERCCDGLQAFGGRAISALLIVIFHKYIFFSLLRVLLIFTIIIVGYRPLG